MWEGEDGVQKLVDTFTTNNTTCIQSVPFNPRSMTLQHNGTKINFYATKDKAVDLDIPSGYTKVEYDDKLLQENIKLKEQVKELEKDNEELSDSFIEMEEEIEELKKQLKELKQ